MKKKFFIHVGTAKTGTTTIQTFFRNSVLNLITHDWMYPQSMGPGPHIQLTACFLDFDHSHPILRLLGIKTPDQLNDHRALVMSKFKSELDNSAGNKIFISDEHISICLHENELKRLGDFLKEYGDVAAIVIYLRRQDRYLVSNNSEALKMMLFDCINARDLAHSCWYQNFPYEYRYAEILENLKQAFPESEFIVRPYIEEPNFDAVADIKTCLGLDGFSQTNAVERQNSGLPHSAFRSLILIGALAKKNNEHILLDNWRSFLSAVSKNVSGPGPSLTCNEAETFLSCFKEENYRLCSDYPVLSRTLCNEINIHTADNLSVELDPLSLFELVREYVESDIRQALARICQYLADSANPYEAAFSNEVLLRWQAIKQANLEYLACRVR